MPSYVTIAEEQVDVDDPCAVASALRKAELMIVSGGGIIRARFGEDDVQFSTGNMSRLRDLIALYEGRCAAKSGERRRYAKRIRYASR